MQKECRKCQKLKNVKHFHKDKTSKDGLYRWCKPCKTEYDKQYRADYYNRPEIKEYFASEKHRLDKQNEWLKDYQNRLFRRAKGQAYERNLAFDLRKEDFVLPEVCPILETPLVYIIGKGINWNSPTIDRIDSSKGYVTGNVWIISRLANTMKSLANTKQLETFSINILKHISNGVNFGD